MDLKITNTKPENWEDALAIAKQFEADYPDRQGFAGGVAFVHMKGARPPFYAYRTKTSIVVRGNLEGVQ
ncbi:hypothetical protein [Agrobacterium pusense]|uniref:hypothetical protein n=1 Tax=Agrobacterium pusense TaxID=648995 RepID=UPI00345E7B2F